MVARLLLRGMIAGCLAGLLAVCFFAFAGEPSIEGAIAFEQASAPAETSPGPELVSREAQRSFGLLAAGAIHGTALGGLFALAFAFLYGRIETSDPRAIALGLSAAGFVAIALVPGLKYPASPPAVGSPETIGPRTASYLAMVGLSLLALLLAALARGALQRRFGRWNGTLAAALVFLVGSVFAALILPDAEEIPPGFPAGVLWTFRLAAFGTQAVLWTALGLIFGPMVAAPETRCAAPARSSR
jgi:predicted cobalt transporter CbtA